MANPTTVTCPAAAWTPIVAGVSNATLKILEPKAGYHFTYRTNGDPAPTGDDWKNVQRCNKPAAYVCLPSGSTAIDVYCWCPAGLDGIVEVEI
jgi:hypothetical protein